MDTNKSAACAADDAEQEILEFIIAGSSFGVNLGQIAELVQKQVPQPIPNFHPCIEGVVNPRGKTYALVDLAKYFNLSASSSPDKDIYIISRLNKDALCFHVHKAEGIHRLNSQKIPKPADLLNGAGEGVITGIIEAEGRIIAVVDFEKIAADLRGYFTLLPEDEPLTTAN